jgi:hypothetical protein
MKTPCPDRWTAFLLSLAVPGAGQFFAGRWSCAAWFVATAFLGAGTALLTPFSPTVAAVASFLALGLLGLASAEHARRCLEPVARDRKLSGRVLCALAQSRAVHLRIEVDVPRPAAEVWRLVADLPRFGCVDPFHSRVVVLGPRLKRGVGLALEHRAFGLRFWRFGRLLTWKEGQGYAFSDLSARGPRRGFPHVFFVSLLSVASSRTCLRIEVRGRWTARWLPLWASRCWLRFVCREHAQLLRAWFSEEDLWLTPPIPSRVTGFNSPRRTPVNRF